MIKVDIVNEVSKIADITKVKAEVAVDAVFDAMRTSMQRGERIAALAQDAFLPFHQLAPKIFLLALIHEGLSIRRFVAVLDHPGQAHARESSAWFRRPYSEPLGASQ